MNAELRACPTACDSDCDAACHEGHQVPVKRTHTLDSCQSPNGPEWAAWVPKEEPTLPAAAAAEPLDRGQRVEGGQAVAVAQAWGSKRTEDVVAARRSKSLGCKITEHRDGYWECHACGDCGFPMGDD